MFEVSDSVYIKRFTEEQRIRYNKFKLEWQVDEKRPSERVGVISGTPTNVGVEVYSVAVTIEAPNYLGVRVERFIYFADELDFISKGAGEIIKRWLTN